MVERPTPPPPVAIDPVSPLLNCESVAAIFGCHPRHVQRMNAEGTMPAGLKIGKMLRWNPAIIDAWIAAGCPVPEKKGAAQ